MGRILLQTAHRRIPSEGVSMGGFALWIPASSACARFLLLPGTRALPEILLTARSAAARRGWTDGSDSAARWSWQGPTTPVP